jgi:hypothetical protein
VQLLDHFGMLILEKMFCSDERYHQFQVDGNLQYTCPTCRGECYQVCKCLQYIITFVSQCKKCFEEMLFAECIVYLCVSGQES